MIERENYSEAAIANRLMHLLLAILAGFGVVALALSYWSIVRTETLAGRADNPRTVEAELRVQRGSILDRNNVVLAENSGPLNQQSRYYPLAEAGPAVGHYSLRFGATGVEASYDQLLRGDDVTSTELALNELLHIPPAGRDVRLALDSTLQQSATHLMEGQKGALILIELTGSAKEPKADIRAMVSQPWYDPADLDNLFENLDEGEDASFFNRVTQGQYQPGLTLLPLLAAMAIDDSTIDPAGIVDDADRLVGVDGLAERCLTPPEKEPTTWLDGVRGLCSGIAVDLGELMGTQGLAQSFKALGFTSTPLIPIPAAEAADLTIADAANAALGQEALTISPLQLALAYAALAGNGNLPRARIVDAVQSTSGQWVTDDTLAAADPGGSAFRPETAALVRRSLISTDDISGISVPVLSAADGQTNQWFVGLTPSAAPRYIVVVVLEQPDNPQTAEEIGNTILMQAMLLP